MIMQVRLAHARGELVLGSQTMMEERAGLQSTFDRARQGALQ